ncbi:MAG: site-2 protease family protein [Gammaproteobacteria bacterium]|nr:MAG: site-2 protease family protein [Gammaproteobacteria bacterium]RLA56211.1 MAG: site-2 protease family protein [Gammaproteobacteria bacterium]HDY81635.1 site-2 protease family protein [Halieaceae bacterium]
MKWSWKITRIAGIDIYIHATFLLLIYLIGISYWNQHGTVSAVISGVGFILALFCCVVLHEFGHSLTARRYGIQTRSITLLPIGGVASLEKMPDDPRQEINVAIAGPTVNFVIAILLYLYIDFQNVPMTAEELSVTGGSFLYRLMIVNVFIGVFNLLPAFPMDGGRVLRAALALRMDHAKATQKAASVGRLLAIGMGLLGIMYNPFLLFIAIFIWFGATIESSAEQLKSILSHASVRHAILREFHTLSPQDNLARAIELTLAGSQKDFPVGYQDKLDKVLYHSDLIKGLQEKGEYARISDLPLQDIFNADINEPLGKLLERMRGNTAQMIYVTEGEKIVGLLNLENIMEMIKIQEAIEKHHTSQG